MISKKLTERKAVHCNRKLTNTARAAYSEKFLTAGIVDMAPREKATVSQHAESNILGPIRPNTIDIWGGWGEEIVSKN